MRCHERGALHAVAGPAAFGRRADNIPAGPGRGGRLDSATEPLSGLRVKNPKFPAIVLAERLANLCFVKVGQLRWPYVPHVALGHMRLTFVKQRSPECCASSTCQQQPCHASPAWHA